MYRVAVCDDEQITCTELKQMVEANAQLLEEQFQIEIFLTGEQLFEKLNEGERYDFLFLDINLQTVDGINVGKYIREGLQDYKTLIIYISSDQSYAMSLFQVQPFDFLIKPLSCEMVSKVLKKGIRQFKTSRRFFEYQKNKSIYKVECEDILYIFSDRKKLVMKRMNHEIDEFYGKLKEVAGRLPENFFMISQSYVINTDYVQRYNYEEVTMMDQQTFLISRAHRKEIREKILKQKRED